MKSNTLLTHRLTLATLGILLGSWLFTCPSACAQNKLQNGDFEQPLGTTNWTIHYVLGGADDWFIKDRTTSAAASNRAAQLNDRGLHFRPSTEKLAHAYYSQTVSNLDAGRTYTITGKLWCEGPGFGGANLKYRIYFEAIGGQAPTRSPDGPYDSVGGGVYTSYSITQTPDANGNIEVRLHCDHFQFVNYDKLVLMNGYFDDFTLTP